LFWNHYPAADIPPRLSLFSKTPPIVFCPSDIVAGKSVGAGGVFEMGVCGGG
jgi:hypothetical protein